MSKRPNELEYWLDEFHPDIKAQANRENAEMYWGDETRIHNDSQHERGLCIFDCRVNK